MKSLRYPRYDFRTKLSSGASGTEIVNALILEPWIEIISTWSYLEKPESLHSEFCEAIRYNIGVGRYNPLALVNLIEYPEFYQAVLTGLLEVWNNYPLHLNLDPQSGGLFIGKVPQNIEIRKEGRTHLIDHIRTSGNCSLHFQGQINQTGIWMTRIVRETYRLINLLLSKLP